MAETSARAEFEAVYDDDRGGAQQMWRHPLEVGRPVKLGRVAGQADWCVPDPLISGWHATVTWDGSRLTVRERHPEPPRNKIWVNGQAVPEASLGPGESFRIGTSTFRVRLDDPAAEVVDSPAAAEHTYTRAQLRGTAAGNPAAILAALRDVPDLLRTVTNMDLLFPRLLGLMLKSLPRSAWAAVVELPADADPDQRPGVRFRHVPRANLDVPAAGVPSRRLVHKSLGEKTSVVQVGRGGDSQTTFGLVADDGVPWAVCTPLQDDSGLGLYFTGSLATSDLLRGADDPTLKDYVQLIELVAGLVESTIAQREQQRLIEYLRRFLPAGRLRRAAGADALEQLLEPRLATTPVLFCDIRGSCEIAADGDLLAVYRQMADALNEMSGVVAQSGGTIANFLGDAVVAVWGWPDDQPDAVRRAAEAALRIRGLFDEHGWFREFRCGIGLTTGPVLAGQLGAHDLSKVSVFGPAVNLAARLESLTKQLGVRVLIDDRTAAGVAPEVGLLRKLGRFRPAGMDGLTAGVGVLALLPPTDPSRGGLRRWEDRVLKPFQAGDWAAAREVIDTFFPDDPPGRFLVEFMDAHAGRPPAGCDGVVPLTQK